MGVEQPIENEERRGSILRHRVVKRARERATHDLQLDVGSLRSGDDSDSFCRPFLSSLHSQDDIDPSNVFGLEKSVDPRLPIWSKLAFRWRRKDDKRDGFCEVDDMTEPDPSQSRSSGVREVGRRC